MFESVDDILTIPEVADILKIGISHAYKLVRSGEIKAFKSGKDWKISKQALTSYVMEQSKL